MESKRLEMNFKTEASNRFRLSVDEPEEGIDREEVTDLMNEIIGEDIFHRDGEALESIEGANLVTRTVVEIV